MGLLQQALHRKKKPDMNSNAGLLNKALTIFETAPKNYNEKSDADQKKNELGNDFIVTDYQTDIGDTDSSINIRENLPAEAVDFVKRILDTSESVLYVKIQFDPVKNTHAIFNKIVKAFSMFFSGQAFVFSNQDYSVGVMSRFGTYDQELLIHQLKKIIRNNQEVDEKSFSFTVDCISDIKL